MMRKKFEMFMQFLAWRRQKINAIYERRKHFYNSFRIYREITKQLTQVAFNEINQQKAAWNMLIFGFGQIE